ncbi:ATP-binding cassette domain-containing protein [Streptomyces sp. 3MP-14]|uniref:ATP-binding cassette domain-containing protein n=1 Tax=Streptomyces mimosae TaxID=2586635 RepID=A0A5N6AA31_9ACTN|nr:MULTISPECIES: ABC transporter ATP-binding protein [Streptomyces]KAB8164610.1 ATP-binding cassette domain-containing protein [Streptomyces mimosae]KAB8175526.1 ATP-binding cassette domain-containing protein [Streptomyces sp. 3MP-14]
MSATATSPAATTVPHRKRSVVRALLRLWPYVRPARGRVFSAAGVAVVAASMGLVMPLVLKWMVDGPVAEGDTGGVWWGGVVLLLVGLTEAALFGLRRWLVARPLARVEANMRDAIYRHLQRLPVTFHDRWPTGQLLSRATGDLQLLRMFLAFGLTFLIVNSTTILIGFGVLLVQDWTLGLVLVLPVVPLIVLCALFERRFSLVARRAQDQMGDLTTVVEESILGIRIIKGFGRHRSQARAFRLLSGELRDTELYKARLLAGIWLVILALPELFLGTALVLGVSQVADGELTAGTLVAFMATAMVLRWPVESMGFLLALCNEAATATDRYFEVLDTEIPDEPTPATPAAGDGGTPGDGIRLTNVVFHYPDAPPGSPPVLDGVTLHVRTGETMALVGATGSGKTTLLALLPRLHEVTSGRITLDGVDTATLSRAEVRSRIAVAFEEPTLFSASVAENVLMGAEHADEAELARALRVSQADGFVRALPEGLETEVGEQGLSLSGGQRQRLALARAVVGKPRFLVLDDPLSALDVHTEARVEAALREVLVDTTALVVAHRPSTVQLADRVALLSEGRVAAVGTHTELLRDNAEYRRLMTGESQLSQGRDRESNGGSLTAPSRTA